MRYKLLMTFFLLLIATPGKLEAQIPTPLLVETLRSAKPTVVKTGEFFTQTYRVKFLDLLSWGERIEILTDELAVDKISAGHFEVLKLEVEKHTQGEYFIWDFIYTLRIINSQKGIYKIPPLRFSWIHKKIGQRSEEAEEIKFFDSEEVPINYVTTVVPEPFLDVRDDLNLDPLAWTARILMIMSWFLPAVVLLGGLIWLFRPVKERGSEDDSENILEPLPASSSYASPSLLSRKMIEKELRRSLKKLIAAELKTDRPAERIALVLPLKERVLAALVECVKWEIPALSRGSTPQEIAAGLLEANTKPGRQRKVLSALIGWAVKGEQEVERGALAADRSHSATGAELKVLLAQRKRLTALLKIIIWPGSQLIKISRRLKLGRREN